MIFFSNELTGIWTPLSQTKTSAWDADMLPPHHDGIANEQSIFYRGQDLLLYRLIWAGYYYLVSLMGLVISIVQNETASQLLFVIIIS